MSTLHAIPLDDGRMEVTHPTLLEAVGELASQGMALGPALEVFEDVRRQCETISKSLVALIYDPLSGKIAAGRVDVAIPGGKVIPLEESIH